MLAALPLAGKQSQQQLWADAGQGQPLKNTTCVFCLQTAWATLPADTFIRSLSFFLWEMKSGLANAPAPAQLLCASTEILLASHWFLSRVQKTSFSLIRTQTAAVQVGKFGQAAEKLPKICGKIKKHLSKTKVEWKLKNSIEKRVIYSYSLYAASVEFTYI